MTITWPSFRSIIRQEMKTLQQLEFPVVYSKNNFDNAEILIFADQYDKFEIEIPNKIKEIVGRLSECIHRDCSSKCVFLTLANE